MVTYHESSQKQLTNVKRERKGKDPEVDEALNQWFELVTSKGQRVSGPMLKEKAEELAHLLGNSDFLATEGWISRWKVRHQIKAKKVHGEKASADSVNAKHWLETVLPELMKDYESQDVFNADETALFYRATPDGSLCYAYKNLCGSKKAMERLTVLCCANMTGSDKCKLFIIGKSKSPRCFKGINMTNFPVTYRANKNAWMTKTMFEEWLIEWDMILGSKNRKILLIVDNCSAHPKECSLRNIRLEFLPPNTTSLIQPMDMGVIQNVKTLYRKELVKTTLDYIEQDLLSVTATAIDVSSKISILDAVGFISKSWRAVKSTTIANCFHKAGFSNNTLLSNETPVTNECISLGIEEVVNGEEYDEIDHDDTTCFEPENFDNVEEIVEEMKRKRRNVNEIESSDDEDLCPEIQQKVTNNEAKRSCYLLQRYFIEQGLDRTKIDDCADKIHLNAGRSLKQQSITSFFN